MPHLQRWIDAIRARPAVLKGIEMPPSSLNMRVDDEDKAKQFAEEARKMVETGKGREAGV